MLTSKACIPVPVGIDSTAGGARDLGAGLTPHTVLYMMQFTQSVKHCNSGHTTTQRQN